MTGAEFRSLQRVAGFHLAAWRQHPDYEDLVQEAVVGAWIAWRKAEGAHPIAAFLKLAARWRGIDWLRHRTLLGRRGQRQALECVLLPEVTVEPDYPTAAAQAEQRQVWARVMSRLSRRDQSVVALVIGEGLTYDEAARRLQVSRDTVKHVLRRALDQERRYQGLPVYQRPSRRRRTNAE